MKTVTVRELRNEFPRIEAWLKEGEQISISKRGTVIGILTSPEKAASRRKAKMPDFMARLKKNWGNRMLSQNEVESLRAFEQEGQEG